MPPTSNIITEKNEWQMASLFWKPNYLEPSAWVEHIPFAFWLIDSLRPNTLVELGVYNGTSYFSFCQAIDRLNLNTKTYAIDTWEGDEHAGFYPDDIYKKVSEYNVDNYARFSTLIRSTFNEARLYFTPKSIDVLHLDGFHTYDAVKHDFETWFPALTENAVVIFHDINVRERGFGVYQFWLELQNKYRHFEFDFGFGLGVICLGMEYSTVLNSLFDNNKQSIYYSGLKNMFSERGQFFKKHIEMQFKKNELTELQNKLIQKEAYSKQLETSIEELKNELSEKANKLENFLLAQNLSKESTKNEIQLQKNELENIYKELKRDLNDVILEKKVLYKKNLRLEISSRNKDNFLQELTTELTILKNNIAKTEKEKGNETLLIDQLRYHNELANNQVFKSDNLNKELNKKVNELEQQAYETSKALSLKNEIIIDLEAEKLKLIKNEEIEKKSKSLLSELLEKSETDRMRLIDEVAYNTSVINLLEKQSEDAVPYQVQLYAKLRIANQFWENRSPFLIRQIKKIFLKFPFYIKSRLLILKWIIQGKKSDFLYKVRFWEKNRIVPYEVIDDYLAIVNSPFFDKNWYLEKYADVKQDNQDPVLHYMNYGYYEGRNPSPIFSSIKYFINNKDVMESGENPLLHYLYYGQREGRAAIPVVEGTGNNIVTYSHNTVEDLSQITPPPISISSMTTSDFQDAITHFEPNFLDNHIQLSKKRNISSIKKVAFIAQPEYFSFHYLNVLEEFYDVKYFSNSFSEDPQFFSTLVEYDADINIFFRGELIPAATLNSLTGVNIALSSEPFPKIIHGAVQYTEDSLERFKFFLRIFELPYDYIFHYDEVSRQFFEKQGVNLSGFFPFPIDTENIKPIDSEKKWDLFFSGRSTPHRDQYFGPLKRDFKFLHINHGVDGNDLIDFIQKCKIAINVHAENEISWEPRTQFLMAAGILLVSEPLSPTCPLRPGVDFVEVRNSHEMYDVCKRIINNYEDYKHIANSGRKRVVEYLSSKKNFPTFFEDVLLNKYKTASLNKNRLNLNVLNTNLRYNGFEHLLTELLHEHA